MATSGLEPLPTVNGVPARAAGHSSAKATAAMAMNRPGRMARTTLRLRPRPRKGGSGDRVAAVDGDELAGQVARLVGEQEREQTVELAGLTRPPERDAHLEHLGDRALDEVV